MRHFSRGGAALEFALLVPVLMLMVLGAADVAGLVSQQQRAQAAAAAAADLAAETEQFTAETSVAQIRTGREVAVLALAASEAARPDALFSHGALIVTGIANNGQGPAPVWQQRWGRADVASQASAAGLAITPGQGLLVAEVVLVAHPWRFTGALLGLPETVELRRMAVRRPKSALALALAR